MSDGPQNDVRGRISISRLLVLVAIWAMASALPGWLPVVPMPGGWGYFLFAFSFYMLPLGLPLSLLLLRGRKSVGWLTVGLTISIVVVVYHYIILTRAHRSFNFPESLWLLAVFAGLGAGSVGSLAATVSAARDRRWLALSVWAIAASASACAYWLLRWLVLYAG